MGTRIDRLRAAQSELNGAGKPAVREAERREPEPEAQSQEPEAAQQERPAGPSAWRWSRGADAGCLVILVLFVFLGLGAYVREDWGWLTLYGIGTSVLIIALLVHAATAGRRFGRP